MSIGRQAAKSTWGGVTSPLDLLYRPLGSAEWAGPVLPHGHRLAFEEDSGIVYELDLVGGQAPPRGTTLAQVIVQRSFQASTDVCYIPRAELRCSSRSGAPGLKLRIVGQRAELPELPEGLAGWDGRFLTHLTYTANHQTLPLLLATLLAVPPPGARGIQPARPGRLAAVQADAPVDLLALDAAGMGAALEAAAAPGPDADDPPILPED